MYDPKCQELARWMLSDCRSVQPEDSDKLAQEIQDAIERWVEDNFKEEDRP